MGIETLYKEVMDLNMMADNADKEAAAKAMPKGRFLPYDGVGHAPFLEDPDRFAADLSAFVQDTRKEQAA